MSACAFACLCVWSSSTFSLLLALSIGVIKNREQSPRGSSPLWSQFSGSWAGESRIQGQPGLDSKTLSQKWGAGVGENESH
jgi:hypothetical protein